MARSAAFGTQSAFCATKKSALKAAPLETPKWERASLTIGFAHLQPIVCLISSVFILAMPVLLNYIVAFFLNASVIIGLWRVR